MNGFNVFENLRMLGCTVEPCGSRVTVRPPPTDTDADYLVEVPRSFFGGTYRAAMKVLREADFRREGKEYQGGVFESFRRSVDNLVVTRDREFARRHRAATSVCKALNLREKADRVRVFQAVLYGN